MKKLSNLVIKNVSTYDNGNDYLIETTLDINGVNYEVAISLYPNGWFVLSSKKTEGTRYSSFGQETQDQLVEFILENYKNEVNENEVITSTITVKKLTKSEQKEIRKNEIIQEIKEIVNEYGNTVYTELRHVSQSGMLRAIKVYLSNESIDITDLVAELLGYSHHNKGGLKVIGCGMDMGFDIVYNLSSQLYKGEYFTDEYGRNREPGYKLNHRWL